MRILPNNTTLVYEYIGKKIYRTTSSDKTNYFLWYDNENNYFHSLDDCISDIQSRINAIDFKHSHYIECITDTDAKFFHNLILTTNNYRKYSAFTDTKNNTFNTCFVNDTLTEKIVIREFL